MRYAGQPIPVGGPGRPRRRGRRRGRARPAGSARAAGIRGRSATRRTPRGPARSSSSPASDTPPPITTTLGSSAAARLAMPAAEPAAHRGEDLHRGQVALPGRGGHQAGRSARSGRRRPAPAAGVRRPARPRPVRARRGPARCRTRTSPSSRGCRTRSAGRPARPHVARTRRPPRTRRGRACRDTTRPPPIPVPSVTQTTPLTARGAEPVLGPGGRVGVVLDRHRQPDPAGQRIPQRLVAPGQVRREQHGRPVVGDPARRADADRDDLVPRGQLGHHLGDHVLGVDDVARGGSAASADHAARRRRPHRRRPWCRRCRPRSRGSRALVQRDQLQPRVGSGGAGGAAGARTSRAASRARRPRRRPRRRGLVASAARRVRPTAHPARARGSSARRGQPRRWVQQRAHDVDDGRSRSGELVGHVRPVAAQRGDELAIGHRSTPARRLRCAPSRSSPNRARAHSCTASASSRPASDAAVPSAPLGPVVTFAANSRVGPEPDP